MSDVLLYCSFCRRDHHHVAKLVSGPGVHICDGCVDLARRAMRGTAIPEFAGFDALSDEELLQSLVAAETVVRLTNDNIGDVVRVLRARRITWARIGGALGISRQAAWERLAAHE